MYLRDSVCLYSWDLLSVEPEDIGICCFDLGFVLSFFKVFFGSDLRCFIKQRPTPLDQKVFFYGLATAVVLLWFAMAMQYTFKNLLFS